MTPLLWLVAGHLLGDFAFQSEWMAMNKGKSWEINLYHAAVYTATICVVAAIGGVTLSVLALAILLVSHFCIDPFKARWNLIRSIWIDQLLHFIVLIAVIATL
jgi:hypothetical protein